MHRWSPNIDPAASGLSKSGTTSFNSADARAEKRWHFPVYDGKSVLCERASNLNVLMRPTFLSQRAVYLVKGQKAGCPVRIRTSIDGVRVRSLTIRRRGISYAAGCPASDGSGNRYSPAARGANSFKWHHGQGRTAVLACSNCIVPLASAASLRELFAGGKRKY